MTWIFALAVPPLLLIVFGAIPAFREADPALGGLRVIDLYAPILVAVGVTILAVYSLPQQFAGYRERGVLRRMRTTPVRPPALLGALLLLFTALGVCTLALVLVLARLAYGVPLPAAPLAYASAYLLTVLALFSLGLLVAALAPSATSASAVGLVLFFSLAFFGGLWIPRDRMSDVLRAASDLTPVGAGVQSLQDAAAGGWPSLLSILVLMGWTIVAGGSAARLFRWE
ncbi:transport permease protein [Microbacterium album]|uniref:Transport permease protein n=2 Tax=Microbacterium album TaxID=2053191 RepID=A0A917IBU4_9MICO|nr:transport permease protein [Microbacterium album]